MNYKSFNETPLKGQKMDRMLQFAFLTFTATAVVGIAAILYLVVNKDMNAIMFAIESGMRG